MENDQNVTLLDIRTKEEFKSHHVRGAQLIPLGELEKNLKKLEGNKNKKIIVYCQTGRRSVSASRILENNGFTPLNVEGGIISMKHVGLRWLNKILSWKHGFCLTHLFKQLIIDFQSCFKTLTAL